MNDFFLPGAQCHANPDLISALLDHVRNHAIESDCGEHHGKHSKKTGKSSHQAVAQQGITVQSFPAGTVFSVRMSPLRDGGNFGSRVGAIAKCPKGKFPEAGKHCDSVEGAEILGGTTF